MRFLNFCQQELLKNYSSFKFFSSFIFQDIRPMRDQIVRVKRFEKVPLILVGNKVDLESEREVSRSDGRALAQEWGCPFIETSAKSKTMVDELFAEIVRQMNYSTLPEKQEQCCTACVVQWRRGASTSIYTYYWLSFSLFFFFPLNVTITEQATVNFYSFRKCDEMFLQCL